MCKNSFRNSDAFHEYTLGFNSNCGDKNLYNF